MAAYLMAFVTVTDAAKMQEYAAMAVPTIAAAGGSVVTRGKVVKTLAGSFSADSCLIVKFANAAAAQAWYDSPAYQAAVPLREQALKPNFVLIEEPS